MTIRTARILIAASLVLAMSSAALASPAEVINNFAFNAAGLLGRTEGSWFFSPFSIISAFGMAYAGAGGETAAEIERALGFTQGLHEDLRELARDLSMGGYLSSANRVWLSKGLKLNAAYQDNMLMYYGSTAKELDIKGKTEASRKAINDWVSKKTNGKIPTLLNTLDPSARMIITNAVYFKAKWQHVFDKSRTAPEKFRDGERVTEVPMMKKQDDLMFGEFDGVKVVNIPYDGRRISFIAVLPPEGEKPAGLDAETFRGWTEALSKHDVDLWLPKFRTEGSYEMAGVFKALGVKLAFSDEADFSGIAKDEGLKADAVLHKTFIDVDEEKTEAAAATGMVMLGATMMKTTPKAEFHADRPFMYFIWDSWTGSILFMGRQTF